MDILADAKTHLSPETLSGLPSHLGIEPPILPQLIEETLPALLAIFGKAAQDPTKAGLVTQYLTEIDSQILADPNAILSEHGPDLMRSGKSGLAKLLGPQLTDYIAPLAKSTGLGEGKVASALGSLAPFVLALLSQKTKDASELPALLDEKELAAPAPDTKVAPKEEAPAKSYLPDPNKKREKRPFPKRKAILVVLLLALVAALLFWLVDSGLVTLPELPTREPAAPTIETPLLDDSPASETPLLEDSPDTIPSIEI